MTVVPLTVEIEMMSGVLGDFSVPIAQQVVVLLQTIWVSAPIVTLRV